MNKRLIDLSHTIEDGLITYKGLPAPIVCDFLKREDSEPHYASGTQFQIARIDMVVNSGTYVDAPSHRYADGKDISELPLVSLANLETVVVHRDYHQGRATDALAFQNVDVEGKAVLIHTGWSEHWNTEQYFENHSFLTEDAAIYLRDHGAVFVGIDSLNIDDTTVGSRPVHTILLKHEIPICEHLTNLGALPDSGFKFFAVPVKVKAVGSFPVRAFGVV